MATEWPSVSLGDVINLKRGYDLAARDRESGCVPIISSSGPTGTHSKAMVDAPGVVTGRYGTIGLVHYVEEPFWPLNTTLYVQDFKGNDPRFVYYLLKTISYRDYLDKAAVPGINRNDVHRAIVCLPPIHEQESIAATMHCLDIGIESHRAENETIEEIARAIFKSWFVDFDPVKAKAEGREPEGMDAATAALFPSDLVESQLGLVPAGWRVLTIADCTRVGRGASPRPINDYMDGDVPWIKIADATSGDGTFIFETKERVKQAGVSKSVEVVPGDLVMSNSASCGIPVFVEIYGCIHDGWLYFRDYQSITKHYLYYWLKNISAHLVHLADGSVQKNLNTTLVSSQPILVPPQPLMDHFDQVAVGLLVEMRNNIRLCRTLADLRNTLLPRLLSGKLHVPEAEAMVMEVVR